MAAILLDIDGVLHVSGEADAGGGRRRAALCVPTGTGSASSRTTLRRSRERLADELRGLGDRARRRRAQTTPVAAAGLLAGQRVLALTMDGDRDDLAAGSSSSTRTREVVLLGGADESDETGRVFSYVNLNRAFARARARRPPRLPAQEPLVADLARPAARLGRVRRRARVRGGGRGERGRQADARVLRRRARRARRGAGRVDGWRRHRGRHRRRARPRAARRARAHGQVPGGRARAAAARSPTASSSSIAAVPEWLRGAKVKRRRRPDRDRADPRGARALSALPRALFHRGRARVLRLAAESGPALRGALRRQGGRRQGARLRRRPRLRLAGRRDRRAPEARRAALGPDRRPGRSASARGRSTFR